MWFACTVGVCLFVLGKVFLMEIVFYGVLLKGEGEHFMNSKVS